eukprot:COSAG06_NODE_3497_length_5264_cov_7.546563_3_plen_54_part_00
MLPHSCRQGHLANTGEKSKHDVVTLLPVFMNFPLCVQFQGVNTELLFVRKKCA